MIWKLGLFQMVMLHRYSMSMYSCIPNDRSIEVIFNKFTMGATWQNQPKQCLNLCSILQIPYEIPDMECFLPVLGK